MQRIAADSTVPLAETPWAHANVATLRSNSLLLKEGGALTSNRLLAHKVGLHFTSERHAREELSCCSVYENAPLCGEPASPAEGGMNILDCC
jgi:hypothetical protein